MTDVSAASKRRYRPMNLVVTVVILFSTIVLTAYLTEGKPGSTTAIVYVCLNAITWAIRIEARQSETKNQ